MDPNGGGTPSLLEHLGDLADDGRRPPRSRKNLWVMLPPDVEQLVDDLERAILSLPQETGSTSVNRTTSDGVAAVPGVPEPPD